MFSCQVISFPSGVSAVSNKKRRSFPSVVEMKCSVQKEYFVAKPARDAALKAKMEAEAEALLATECPLHDDNECNIRCFS